MEKKREKRVLLQILLILLNFHTLFSQTTNGVLNYTIEGWQGDVNHFNIDTVTSSLHLQGDVTLKQAEIYTSSAVNCGVWKMNINMEFNPSSQNYCEIFLSRQEAGDDMGDAVSVVIGKNYDKLELMHYHNGEAKPLLQSVDGLLNKPNINLSLEVKCDEQGIWRLTYDLGDGLVEMGTTTLTALIEGTNFAWRCVYTSTRATKFHLTDLSIDGYTVIPPPKYHHNPKRHDILFTEFMVDPTPTVSLPDAEYVELYNRCDSAIALADLRLEMNGTLYQLEGDTIYPNDYLTLVDKSNVELMTGVKSVVGISNLPSLNNSGFTIYLKNSNGQVIDGFAYLPNYNDPIKQDGGWSLERGSINTTYFDATIWGWSRNLNGGTPSQQNSFVASDKPTLLKIQSISKISDEVIRLSFNREVQIKSSFVKPLVTPNLTAKEVTFTDSLYRALEVEFSEMISGLTYELIGFDGLVEIPIIENGVFGRASTTKKGDLVINEIMFDPKPDDEEFLELYNTGDSLLESGSLRLRYNNGGLLKLSEPNFYIPPKSYLVLSRDGKICDQLPASNHIICRASSEFPQLSNEGGTIALTRTDETLLDSLTFLPQMHHPFLVSTQGVSLERRCAFTEGDLSCWSSASSTANYATPGQINSSVLLASTDTNGADFVFAFDYFSPNNDGEQDVYTIQRGDGTPQALCTVEVYDASARLIKQIATNRLLYSGDLLFWDGTNNNGQPQPSGIYVLLISGYNPQGEIIKLKHAVVLVM